MRAGRCTLAGIGLWRNPGFIGSPAKIHGLTGDALKLNFDFHASPAVRRSDGLLAMGLDIGGREWDGLKNRAVVLYINQLAFHLIQRKISLVLNSDHGMMNASEKSGVKSSNADMNVVRPVFPVIGSQIHHGALAAKGGTLLVQLADGIAELFIFLLNFLVLHQQLMQLLLGLLQVPACPLVSQTKPQAKDQQQSENEDEKNGFRFHKIKTKLYVCHNPACIFLSAEKACSFAN